jgi:hypothetical protein
VLVFQTKLVGSLEGASSTLLGEAGPQQCRLMCVFSCATATAAANAAASLGGGL